MEFVTGLLLGVCIFEGYLLYKKPKHNKEEISEQEQREQKKREEHLNALLNYDIDVAYGRKR